MSDDKSSRTGGRIKKLIKWVIGVPVGLISVLVILALVFGEQTPIDDTPPEKWQSAMSLSDYNRDCRELDGSEWHDKCGNRRVVWELYIKRTESPDELIAGSDILTLENAFVLALETEESWQEDDDSFIRRKIRVAAITDSGGDGYHDLEPAHIVAWLELDEDEQALKMAAERKELAKDLLKTVTTPCRLAIESLVLLEIDWGWEKFPLQIWNTDPETGLEFIAYQGNNASVVNAFGAERRITYRCDVDPKSKKVLRVAVE